MRKSLYLPMAAVVVSSFVGLTAFRSAAPAEAPKYMQVTTVESIIPGGLGRSKVITTQADGTQTQEDLENFYSLVGINFGNIQKNEQFIVARLNQLEADGWHLQSSTVGVQSPADTKGGGIYMTRYLFKK